MLPMSCRNQGWADEISRLALRLDFWRVSTEGWTGPGLDVFIADGTGNGVALAGSPGVADCFEGGGCWSRSA